MNPVAMDALHELEKLEAHAACIKVEYVVEKHKEPYLEALKIIEVSEKDRLSDRDRFFSEMKKHNKESCKYSRDMVKILDLSDFQPDVHGAIDEILEHRMKTTTEREQVHKVRVEELQEQQLRKPEVQARNARREKCEQLGKERAEHNRQKAMEQAEIDAINNEERGLGAAYQVNFNELEEAIRKDEAEVEQLMVKIGRDSVSTVPTISTMPAVESSTEQPNAQVVTEQAKGLPFCTVKMKIDDTLPRFSADLDDMSTHLERLFQNVYANVNESGENSSSQASSRSRSVSNESRRSDLVSHQLVDQNDHSRVRSERSEHSIRSNEPNLNEASNNNAATAPPKAPPKAPPTAPVFVAPSMPAPQVNKRKESASEQMASSTFEPKRRTLENRPPELPRESPQNIPRESPQNIPRKSPQNIPRESSQNMPRQSFEETSRQLSRESPRQSSREQQHQTHREVLRQSPQKEVGFTVRNRNERSEPNLCLVKSEYPNSTQTSMGATPREIVSELYARRGNESSAFQPIATYGFRSDNRAGNIPPIGQSTPKVSGSTSFQANKVLSSAQAPSTAPENRANKKSGDQSSTSRSAQRDGDRGSRNDNDTSGGFNEQSTFDDSSFTEFSFDEPNPGNSNQQPGTSRSAQRDGDRGFQISGSSFEGFPDLVKYPFDRSNKTASSAKGGEKQSNPFDGNQSFSGDFSFAESEAGSFDPNVSDANFDAADFDGGLGFDD